MVATTTTESARQRARREFYAVNQRDSVWEPFIWQNYVVPAALPLPVEADEYRKRSRHTPEEFSAQLQLSLPRLAWTLRGLKKALRERDLDDVLQALGTLKPLVTRIRVAEAVLLPGRPLLPHWKQYSGRIREDYSYYDDTGRAMEALAWGQELDNLLEVRFVDGSPLYCGPRLRHWGQAFWAQPLSVWRTGQERRAIDKLRAKAGQPAACPAGSPTPASEQQSGQHFLRHRSELHLDNFYHALSRPSLSLWSLLGRNGNLRHAVYQLRITLQALDVAPASLPARKSQFFLGGGDRHENVAAWLSHLDSWWQSRVEQRPFNQHQIIYPPPGHPAAVLHTPF